MISDSSIRQRAHAAQGGIALIIVLWVITLLTVIAVSFAHTMRTEVNVVTNGVARLRAQVAADAAVQRAMIEQFKPQTLDGRWAADGSAREWVYRDAKVTVMLLDEAGKIDINTANELVLKGLLTSQGIIEEDALKLLDAIADWKDADSLKRLRGAEQAEYDAAGLAYGPANAPFQASEELKLVLGVTPDIYARLAPHITVFSRQPGINEQIASRDVLRALPGLSDEVIDTYIAARDAARANKQPIPTLPANRFRSFSAGLVTRVRADAVTPEGVKFSREAVVRRNNDPKRAIAFLSWKEGRELPVIDPQNLATPGANDTSGNTLGRVVPASGR